MSADAFDQAAHDLLDACVLLLDNNTDLRAPARQLVSPGEPASDCDMLAVWCGATGESTTSPLAPSPASGYRQVFGRVNLVTLNVRIIRCVQTSGQGGEAQEVALLEQASAVSNVDAWVLWCGLMYMVRHNMLFDRNNEIHFDSCTALATEGFVGGYQLVMRVALPAFVPILGT